MMRKVELLAPAGTMESLHAAVQCGCDAVYLGGTMFGARAYAGNFDDAQMKEAIRYAHIHGVRVYVTMNTLLDETEIDAAFDYARFLYEHDVDALIIQDLGLAERVHTQLPDLELHASTQMHIHNRMGIETARRLGMKRVVLPRESTIEEIRCRESGHGSGGVRARRIMHELFGTMPDERGAVWTFRQSRRMRPALPDALCAHRER